MNRKVISIFNIILLLFFLQSVASGYADVVFSIRFFDKKLYYPESNIELKIILSNLSPDIYRFRLADNRIFSLGFEVKSLANQPVRQAKKFISDKNSNQAVFFREIRIDSGEEFSFNIDLKDFIEIEQSGIYTVQGIFFPELYNSANEQAIFSNPLTLQVRPSLGGLEAVKAKIDQDTGELLKENPLPPDQTIQYILEARRKSQWNKFFLYIDIDSLFQKSPAGARSYKNMSESVRIEAIKKFKEELISLKIDTEMLTIPSEYEIIKTTYTAREGIVEVIEKFVQKGYKEVKQYTYFLYKKDSIWKIYNYDVRNLGTE